MTLLKGLFLFVALPGFSAWVLTAAGSISENINNRILEKEHQRRVNSLETHKTD